MAQKDRQIENIWWIDAVLWSNGKLPEGPTKMMTKGVAVGENDNYLIVKHPLTYRFDSGLKEYVPKDYGEEPAFFLIPLAAVVRRERSSGLHGAVKRTRGTKLPTSTSTP